MASTLSSTFSPGTWAEDGCIAAVLRKETVGGGLLLLATLFALCAAGVVVGGWSGLQSASDPIAMGIVVALVAGKPIGVLLATYLTAKLTRRPLQKGLTWHDLTGVAMLAGIGFTVYLLIGELAFGGNSTADDHVEIAVLTGSVAAAMFAAVLLRIRNRHYKIISAEEKCDDDHDGIPDIFQQT